MTRWLIGSQCSYDTPDTAVLNLTNHLLLLLCLCFLSAFYYLLSVWRIKMTIQESRATEGRTARCRCKFRYVAYFTTASYVRFPCHSTAFLLVFVCKLQWSICQKVISTKKKQSDCIFNADKYLTWSLSIATVIIIHRQVPTQYNVVNKRNA